MSAKPITSNNKRLRFGGEHRDDFLSTIRKRTNEYFKQNHLSPYATSRLHLKSAMLYISIIAIYLTIILQLFSPSILLFLAMLLGVLSGLIGLNVIHDSLHGSYSKYPRINRLLGYTNDLIGLSSYAWKVSHNGGHHTYTNIAGYDPDIDKPFILRLAPSNPLYPFHYWQHIYIWFLYSLVTLNWVFIGDFQIIAREWERISWKDFSIFLFFKILYIVIYLAIPIYMMTLPWWQVLFGFVCYHLVGGFTVALVFQLAHLVENVAFPMPSDEGTIGNDWGVHEMITTANFATDNTIVNVLLGGLNFQIEHHLMPYVSHAHYKAISAIVRETAKEYGLPYNENPTLFSAIASHYRTLKRLGREAVISNAVPSVQLQKPAIIK